MNVSTDRFPPMNRRQFIHRSALAAATVAATSSLRAAVPGAENDVRIDANVTLFQWPGRRLASDEPVALAGHLKRHGVSQAWAGSFEGLVQRDVRAVNSRLAEACQASRGRLLPFGTVNPTLPDWEADLRQCEETFRMPGIRLYPNYHGYELSDPRFRRLLGLAVERRLLVQIVCLIEDTRTQNALLSVPDVDVAPLPAALAAAPGARVLLLNSGKLVETAAFRPLAELSSVFVDTARVETVGGVGRLIRRLAPGRVVFGSHAPFFHLEAAVIKIFEAELSADEVRSLVADTPRALLRT